MMLASTSTPPETTSFARPPAVKRRQTASAVQIGGEDAQAAGADGEDGEDDGKKKRRVRTGCLACRKRRVRCFEGEDTRTGKKPCKWCKSKGLECRYPSFATGLSRKQRETDEDTEMNEETVLCESGSTVAAVFTVGTSKPVERNLSSGPTSPSTWTTTPSPKADNHTPNPSENGSPATPATDVVVVPRPMTPTHFNSTSSTPIELELLFDFYTTFCAEGPNFFPDSPNARFDKHLVPFLEFCFTSPDRNLDLQLFLYYATLAVSATHRAWRGGPAAGIFFEACESLGVKARKALAKARKGNLPVEGLEKLIVGAFLLTGRDIFLFQPVSIEVTAYDVIETSLPTSKATMVHGAHDILSATSAIIALCDPCDVTLPTLATAHFDSVDVLTGSNQDISSLDLNLELNAERAPTSDIVPLSLSDSPLIPILFGANRRVFSIMTRVAELTRRNMILRSERDVHLNPVLAWKLVCMQKEAQGILFELGDGWGAGAPDVEESSPCVEIGTKIFRHMLEVLLLCEVLVVHLNDWRVHDALLGMLEATAQFSLPYHKECFPLPFLVGAVYALNLDHRYQFRGLLKNIAEVFNLEPEDYFGTKIARHCWDEIEGGLWSDRHYRIAPWRQKLRALGMNIVI
ncbi:hypothetical protein T439DRAFT_5779 [Meredithblackwellia eburnea MCA 4105]